MRAHALSQRFLALVGERQGDDLEAWMAKATDSGIAELARFARGLQDNSSAIIAGLTLEWSNGVIDGQIHRLKLLKRQGYGRASFTLLWQHVLPGGPGMKPGSPPVTKPQGIVARFWYRRVRGVSATRVLAHDG